MKVIIAGSRGITDYELVKLAVKESGFEITQIISGTAKGVDSLGERYGKENSIPVRQMSASWDFYGKSAGYLRNEDMAKEGEALIALWEIDENGVGSKGTRNMISIAKRHGLKVFVKEIRKYRENKGIENLPLFEKDIKSGEQNESKD